MHEKLYKKRRVRQCTKNCRNTLSTAINDRLHIAVAPTKNTARMEWFVEKAVEMGVDEITPIVCDHSERCTLKTERLDKIVVSAMKQSLKALKPATNGPTAVRELLQRPFDGQKFIAYCDGDESRGRRDLMPYGAVLVPGKP